MHSDHQDHQEQNCQSNNQEPNHQEPLDLVTIGNGISTTTSINIAKNFDKEHKHVLRDIKNLGCSKEFRRFNFGPSSYLNYQNKKQPMFDITRDFCYFLLLFVTAFIFFKKKEPIMFEFKDIRKIVYEPKIDEIICYNDIAIKCKEQNERANRSGSFCSECYFQCKTSNHCPQCQSYEDCTCPGHVEFVCHHSGRKDGLNIIFVLL